MSKTHSHKTAADGSCSPTGPKQAGPFGKGPKGAADPHSMVRHSLQSRILGMVMLLGVPQRIRMHAPCCVTPCSMTGGCEALQEAICLHGS